MVISDFFRSFYSPSLYGEIAHEREGFGITYLYKINFIFIVFGIGLSFIIKGINFLSLMHLGSLKIEAILNIGDISNLAGMVSFFIQIGAYLLFGAIAAIIISFISALIMCIFSFIYAAYGMIFKFLLRVQLSYTQIVRLCSYLQYPTHILGSILLYFLPYIIPFDPLPADLNMDATLGMLIKFMINTILLYFALGMIAPITFYLIYALLGTKTYFPLGKTVKSNF